MAEKKPEPVAAAADAPRLVRATKMVFYGGMRIRAGKTFTLKHPREFNPKCMAWADGVADDTATAVDASPKTRGSAGVQMKQPVPAKATVTATLTPDDPGI